MALYWYKQKGVERNNVGRGGGAPIHKLYGYVSP